MILVLIHSTHFFPGSGGRGAEAAPAAREPPAAEAGARGGSRVRRGRRRAGEAGVRQPTSLRTLKPARESVPQPQCESTLPPGSCHSCKVFGQPESAGLCCHGYTCQRVFCVSSAGLCHPCSQDSMTLFAQVNAGAAAAANGAGFTFPAAKPSAATASPAVMKPPLFPVPQKQTPAADTTGAGLTATEVRRPPTISICPSCRSDGNQRCHWSIRPCQFSIACHLVHAASAVCTTGQRSTSGHQPPDRMCILIRRTT